MTTPDFAFRHRRPNRAERRAARSRKATAKLVTGPRQKTGATANGACVNPFTNAPEMDAVTYPERTRPTT